MSLTFFAKSWAYSWKMSLAPQVLCQRQVIGSCALTRVGRVIVATDVAAAPRRNLRRVVVLSAFSLVMLPLLWLTGAALAPVLLCFDKITNPGRFQLIPDLRKVASTCSEAAAPRALRIVIDIAMLAATPATAIRKRNNGGNHDRACTRSRRMASVM